MINPSVNPWISQGLFLKCILLDKRNIQIYNVKITERCIIETRFTSWHDLIIDHPHVEQLPTKKFV